MKESVKEKINQIELPNTLHERCVSGINQAEREMEDNKMNYKKVIRGIVAAAAVLGVCVLTTNYEAIGSATKGFFRDITGWNGAVVGTEYMQETEELKVEVVTVTTEQAYTTLALEVTLTEKEQIPWNCIEEIVLGNYKIVDANGKDVVIVENANAEGQKAEIIDGLAQIDILIEELEENVEYTLLIESFYGMKKADATLKITGNWEYKLVKNQ